MLRMRRYRIFLLVVVLSAASLFYFISHNSDGDRFRFLTYRPKYYSQGQHPQHLPAEHHPDPHPELSVPPPPDPEVVLPVFTATTRRLAHPTLDDYLGPKPTFLASSGPQTITGEELLSKESDKGDDLREINTVSQGLERVEGGGAPLPQWQPQKEHNPVPKENLIRLPDDKPKAFPKIQHTFASETDAEKTDRTRKQVTVREAFKHAWQGYEKYAMPHDELLPMSRSFGDSFMGWGATLIDSLDTLWIMDLKDEFERAVNATSKIDFTTSHKKEIPLFETVIRILGGLISAYDLSRKHYPVLLEKAVELADILMGTFDTPNRLPDMFYKWAPSYASQQHRAGSRVILAQLGSLSMEFTRLAQLTEEDKYYDAIARVQDALEEWQMKTDMPGLWPLVLDASGCGKLDRIKLESESDESEKPILLDTAQLSEEELSKAKAAAHVSQNGTRAPIPHGKRQADDILTPESFDAGQNTGKVLYKQTLPNAESIDPYCKPQGLHYEPYARNRRYGIGAQADSTYEYMPKMHRLLGGLSGQYESMYRNATKMIRDKILYRPMIEDEKRKILFPADFEVDLSKKILGLRVKTWWMGSHLGCFAGGMFALGAKMFDIKTDLEIARQLTDGCIWAYESTPTKIMPELFALTPCEDKNSCPWNEAKWHKALDPNFNERVAAVDTWNSEQKKLYKQTAKNMVKDSGKENGYARPVKPEPTVSQGGIGKVSQNSKRNEPIPRAELKGGDPTKASSYSVIESESGEKSFGFVSKVAMSHSQFVKARIQEERLARGYTKIYDRSYTLRPEAIESVFIMWRITGEEYWREKGWNMFQAIQDATHTEVGNAGLVDVTSILGEKVDMMESFWLAETLKYFFLLFSDPETISLDDYVLNTEAHPFRVPKL